MCSFLTQPAVEPTFTHIQFIVVLIYLITILAKVTLSEMETTGVAKPDLSASLIVVPALSPQWSLFGGTFWILTDLDNLRL